jgi:hypothetical protein
MSPCYQLCTRKCRKLSESFAVGCADVRPYPCAGAVFTSGRPVSGALQSIVGDRARDTALGVFHSGVRNRGELHSVHALSGYERSWTCHRHPCFAILHC